MNEWIDEVLDNSRDDIIERHENLVQKLVEAFDESSLRELLVVHSEARNRILKDSE